MPSPFLLTPFEVDERFRYVPGEAEQLAIDGVLPHVTLPCGSIRFIADEIEAVMRGGPTRQERREFAAAN